MERIRGDQYNGMLYVGQKIYSILYGGRNGVIFHIKGEQRPDTIEHLSSVVCMGGNAEIDVVFSDGTISRCIPECIIRGVQWYIYDDVVDSLVIDQMLAYAEAVKIQKEDAARKKREWLEKERAEMPGRYPYLIPISSAGKIIGYALAAKNIRTELKKAFPCVKFSVRSESYSGGDSIHVYWTDGPTADEVSDITAKYEKGSFDGMRDIYEYNNDNVFCQVFGSAKYIIASRNESDDLLKKVAAEMGYKDAVPDGRGGFTGLTWDESQFIWRKARGTSCITPAQPEPQKTITNTHMSRADEVLYKMGLI